MNIIINATAAIALALFFTTSAMAGGEMKEVCKDKMDKAGKPVIDKKTNKPVQECKKIKVHKKLEGTKVPDKK
jgi:cobalamin biosynthesis protein CobT